jgi:hypothetical protein
MMSDFVQAIDVITKLLPQLKSFTGARRREYFTALICPLFDAFEKVHDFYLALIVDTREGILKIGWGDGAFLHMHQEAQLSLEQLASLERLRDAFAQKRQKDEILRDSLRQDAEQMLARVKWAEERRFLASVGDYFLGEGLPPALTERAVQRQVETLMRRGGDSYWDSPSSELEVELRETTDLRKAIKKLDAMRNKLNQRYMNVRHGFKAVQHEIVERT